MNLENCQKRFSNRRVLWRSGNPTNWVRGETERKINAKFIKFGIEKLFRKEPIFVINAFALGCMGNRSKYYN